MKKRGLLHKMNLKILVILVLCIQIFGSYQVSEISVVKAEGTGTEPKVTIAAPETGEFLNTGSITISGTVENFTSGMTVSLFNGAEPIGTPYQVNSNSWSIPDVILPEGTHNIDAKLVDAEGITVASTIINNLTIDLTPPVITFVNLVDGAFSKSRFIELAAEPDSYVQICTDCSDATTGTWVIVPKDSNGKWIYSNPQMVEGTHTVYAKSIDRAGNEGTPQRITFTLDTLRPIVLMNSMVPTYTENMTQVSISTEIKFRVSDANALNEAEIDKSISVTSNGKDVPGDIHYNSDTKEISFIPSVSPLSRSTKYNVIISPLGVIDSAGNSAFPRFWSFTTESTPPLIDEESGQKLYEIDYNGKNGENVHRESPHAVYANNVNVCGNCHSTHEASKPNLLDQKKNSENGISNPSVDNYCMACHDGTVAPMPENSQATHKHSAEIDISGKPSGSSCSSCHNPHIERSEGNPNLAQDHIVYTHAPGIRKDNIPVGKISSKEQLCESCHESGLGGLVAQPEIDIEYRVFQYKKNISSIGIYEDYDLCLRCHNLNTKSKYNGIADIASFYNNLTEETKEEFETSNSGLSYSNRELSVAESQFSSHIIKAQDGSPLAGHIPCVECHDTHGSNNVKQLKGQIGHEKPIAFNLKTFESTTKEWNAIEQQTFCITCHNGSTEVYGVKGKEIYDGETGEAINPEIPDHNKITTVNETTKPCSECHSTSKTFIEAAHAPKSTK
jgi:hypothetical protein